jgi:PIN domain nuclease of toxin-antitoxin system
VALTMEVGDWIARSDLREDPADRIIVATALSLGARLATRDRKLRGWAGVESVW